MTGAATRRPAPPKPTRAIGDAKRRWTRRRVILLALFATCVGGLFVGWVYEQYAVRRDARRFPPPGAFVDAGGRRLHYICAGGGSPVVLFEVSGFSNALSFSAARDALSTRARVCSYDRMGIGWSDPGPSAIPVGMLAADLGRILDAVSPGAPAILVASSIGGVIVELFARRHPERVAGLVFLDAGNSEGIGRLRDRKLRGLALATCSGLRGAGTVGLMRLFDPWQLRREATARSARSAALMYGSKPWQMLCAMVRAGDATMQEFAEVRPLAGDLPLTVLSAETREAFLPPAIASWFDLGDATAALRASHQRLARRSSRGIWRIVPGSDHLIASSQPQAVVDAVMEMINASGRRAGR